jgi:hypothetical protein
VDVWVDYFAVYHLETADDATGVHAPLTVEGTVDIGACVMGACASFADAEAPRALVIGTDLYDLAGRGGATLSASLVLTSFDTAEGHFSVAWSSELATRHRVALGVRELTGVGWSAVRVHDADAVELFDGGGPVVDASEWRQDVVVDTFAGAVRLFRDGVVVDSGSVPSGEPFDNTPSLKATIGASMTGNYEWRGTLDEVRATVLPRSDEFVRLDQRARAGTLTTLMQVQE